MYRELIAELSKENQYVKIQPPCSEIEIKNAEKETGYTFPNELKNLLRELNGDKWLLLSVKEIVENAKLNRKIKEENEEFAKDLDKLIFFATNGCGDYYCYRMDSDKGIDDNVIYIWEHEEFRLKPIAESMTELITRYYHDEI